MVRRKNGRAQISGTGSSITQQPRQSLQNHLGSLSPLSDAQIEEIDHRTKKLLSHHGIEVLCPNARALYQDAGAAVDEASQIVRIDETLLTSLISTAPACFSYHSYNLDQQIIIGGNHINFGMVSGPPNVHDMISGRRAGNFADYQNFIKLGQSFNAIHFFLVIRR